MNQSGSHSTHSRLAPSAAKRWTTCTASPSYLEANAHKIPEEQTSAYAEEGTLAHDLASDILTKKITLEDIPDPEMKQAVGAYVRLAESLKQEGDTIFIEEKVPLFYAPEDSGTVDFALVNNDRVYVLDLKYGAGIMVDAKENPQLAIYALSLIQELEMVYDFHDGTLVTMTIFQPRTIEGMPTKIWAISLKDLKAWVGFITTSSVYIKNHTEERPLVVFAPSADACQWCSAKGFCKARSDHQAGTFSKEGIDAVKDFLDLEDPPAIPTDGTLTDNQIALVVTAGGDLIKWVNSVQADALERIQGGVAIEGLKLIAGRPGNRAWVSEEEAEKLLKPKLGAAEVFTKKLISISQAEKKLKGEKLSTRFQNRLKELATRGEGKPKLAPASDPSPDISIRAENEFSNEGEDLLV